jgi:YgiT-type zinc finger domain-containing protein
MMECVIRKEGRTRGGTATVTLERGESTIVIKDVPADVCENCGEYYLSEEVARKVEKMAQQAIAHGALIEVPRYAA